MKLLYNSNIFKMSLCFVVNKKVLRIISVYVRLSKVISRALKLKKFTEKELEWLLDWGQGYKVLY